MDNNTRDTIYSIACIVGILIAIAMIGSCCIKEMEMELKYKQHQVK